MRYLKHDMDTLKHLGNDNFNVLLDYVYKNIDNMPLRNIDSLEKTVNGRNAKLFHKGILQVSYYPNINKLEFEGGTSYMKVIDSIIANRTKYYYTPKDSLVKVIFSEWCETKNYKQSEDVFSFHSQDKTETAKRFEAKFNELKQIISNLTGIEPIEKIRSDSRSPVELTWITKNNITINLYGDDFEYGEIRMVIYKE